MICRVKRLPFRIWILVFFIWTARSSRKKYNGKTVEVSGLVLKPREMPPQGFILGRPAMACCADDIGVAGFVCVYPEASALKNNTWVSVTAKIEVAFSQMYNQQGTIFHIQKIKESPAPGRSVGLL